MRGQIGGLFGKRYVCLVVYLPLFRLFHLSNIGSFDIVCCLLFVPSCIRYLFPFPGTLLAWSLAFSLSRLVVIKLWKFCIRRYVFENIVEPSRMEAFRRALVGHLRNRYRYPCLVKEENRFLFPYDIVVRTYLFGYGSLVLALVRSILLPPHLL